MWRVQVWRDGHIVEAELCDTEDLAKEKENELRQKYREASYTFKVGEDKGDPWWSGSLGKGVMPTGGPLHIPYDVSAFGDNQEMKPPKKNTKADSLTWLIIGKLSRTIFAIVDLFKKRR